MTAPILKNRRLVNGRLETIPPGELAALQAKSDAAYHRRRKRQLARSFRVEADKRVKALLNNDKTFDAMPTIMGMWGMLEPIASPEIKKAVEIYDWSWDIARPRARTTADKDVESVNATLDDPFGDGTLWPK